MHGAGRVNQVYYSQVCHLVNQVYYSHACYLVISLLVLLTRFTLRDFILKLQNCCVLGLKKSY